MFKHIGEELARPGISEKKDNFFLKNSRRLHINFCQRFVLLQHESILIFNIFQPNNRNERQKRERDWQIKWP